ncbi:lipase [Acrasis kona]|uniref:Lipase n=1 Tax=Acrasis kona TaxID=1008807 RepID=A0AAW2YZA1_9EUKA
MLRVALLLVIYAVLVCSLSSLNYPKRVKPYNYTNKPNTLFFKNTFKSFSEKVNKIGDKVVGSVSTAIDKISAPNVVARVLDKRFLNFDDYIAVKFAHDAYRSGRALPDTIPNKHQWRVELVSEIPSQSVVTKIYVNDHLGLVVVSYKGTDSISNVIHDLQSLEILSNVVVHNVNVGRVANGFLNVYKMNIQAIEKAVAPYISKNYRLIFTGHSLGGATSTIGALSTAIAYPSANIKLITFASPMVGDGNFKNMVESRIGVIHRWVSQWTNLFTRRTDYDDITQLPPYSFMKHVGERASIVCPYSINLKCHPIADGYIRGMDNDYKG